MQESIITKKTHCKYVGNRAKYLAGAAGGGCAEFLETSGIHTI